LHAGGGDWSDTQFRRMMIETNHVSAGLTTFGHTMAAHRRQGGWRPAPVGIATDLYMFRLFFATDGLSFATEVDPSTLRIGPFWGMMRFPDLEQPPAGAVAGQVGIAEW